MRRGKPNCSRRERRERKRGKRNGKKGRRKKRREKKKRRKKERRGGRREKRGIKKGRGAGQGVGVNGHAARTEREDQEAENVGDVAVPETDTDLTVTAAEVDPRGQEVVTEDDPGAGTKTGKVDTNPVRRARQGTRIGNLLIRRQGQKMDRPRVVTLAQRLLENQREMAPPHKMA